MRTLNFNGKISTLEPLTVTVKMRSQLPAIACLVTVDSMQLRTFQVPAFGELFVMLRIRSLSIMWALMQTENHLSTWQNISCWPGVDINGEAETFAPGEINAGAELRSKNPLISLFGRWGLSGKVGIGNAIPDGDNQWGMFGGGARSIMFQRDESLMEFLETDQVDRLERLLEEQAEASVDISQIKTEQDALKKAMKSADKDTKAELQIKVRELDEKIQARKDQKQESRESIRRPIDPYEAFITGAELSHRMSIKNATDEEAGLFISALIRFAAEPRFGGHANHNCGLVEAHWTVTTWKPGELVPVTLGEIVITPNGVEITGDELFAMVKAFNENQSFDFTAR